MRKAGEAVDCLSGSGPSPWVFVGVGSRRGRVFVGQNALSPRPSRCCPPAPWESGSDPSRLSPTGRCVRRCHGGGPAPSLSRGDERCPGCCRTRSRLLIFLLRPAPPGAGSASRCCRLSASPAESPAAAPGNPAGTGPALPGRKREGLRDVPRTGPPTCPCRSRHVVRGAGWRAPGGSGRPGRSGSRGRGTPRLVRRG